MNNSSKIYYADDFIRNILKSTKTIAMVGLSDNENRPSHFAAKYLKNKGYKIIPVNPVTKEKKILDFKVYKNLEDIEIVPDMVDIFANPKKVIPFVKQAIKIKTKVIWMQLGVINHEAANLVSKTKIKFVMDRCPKIEYARFSGHLGWAGINSNIIYNKVFYLK